MKKLMTSLLLVLSFLLLVACSDDGSFTIDNVTIDAQIDTDGTIHVRELYTYTFDGTFEGMTRSVESDTEQFKAYGIDGQTTDPTISTENLEALTIEEDDDMWKIHSASEDETKQVLYSYIVEGSVKKYQDIADIKYAFFDESNETDLHDVEISIHTPENTITENTRFYLHGNGGGELSTAADQLVYTNDLLVAGKTSEVRLIFPATELSNMELTKDKQMQEEIIAAEQELIERAEHLNQNMEKVTPIMWVLIVVVIIIGIIMLLNHPNRYRGNKSIDEFTQRLEEIDPLFVSYLSLDGNLHPESVIAGLFSLKQRGIVTLQEVPSEIKEEETTFRFTWVKDPSQSDLADGFLHEWLFTENDEAGSYFLLESILDDEDASDSVREKQAEEFTGNHDKWAGLVKAREEYQNLKRPYNGFARFSSILIIITFASFYYMTTVDLLSQTAQIVLPLILAVIGGVCLIFNRYKWLLLAYYPFLLIASLIEFTMTTGAILSIVFYFVCITVLLIIPEKYWRADIVQTVHAIKESRKYMKTGDYPVGSSPNKLEKRLEYAMILGEGEKYAAQCEDNAMINKLDFPLLNNPTYATQSFNTGNIVLLSMFVANSTTTTSTSSSPTGGGGAGAF